VRTLYTNRHLEDILKHFKKAGNIYEVGIIIERERVIPKEIDNVHYKSTFQLPEPIHQVIKQEPSGNSDLLKEKKDSVREQIGRSKNLGQPTLLDTRSSTTLKRSVYKRAQSRITTSPKQYKHQRIELSLSPSSSVSEDGFLDQPNQDVREEIQSSQNQQIERDNKADESINSVHQ